MCPSYSNVLSAIQGRAWVVVTAMLFEVQFRTSWIVMVITPCWLTDRLNTNWRLEGEFLLKKLCFFPGSVFVYRMFFVLSPSFWSQHRMCIFSYAYAVFTTVILKLLLTEVSLKWSVGCLEKHADSPDCPPLHPLESNSTGIKGLILQWYWQEGKFMPEDGTHRLKALWQGSLSESPVRGLHFSLVKGYGLQHTLGSTVSKYFRQHRNAVEKLIPWKGRCSYSSLASLSIRPCVTQGLQGAILMEKAFLKNRRRPLCSSYSFCSEAKLDGICIFTSIPSAGHSL